MDSTHADQLREIDLPVLGRRLRAARTALGLTQGDLAADEVSIAYVSRIEAGQRRPDARLLTAFAERLHTTLDFLLSGVSPREADELRLSLTHAELALHSGDAAEAERRVTALLIDPATGANRAIGDRALLVRARAIAAQDRLDEAIAQLTPLSEVGPTTEVWLSATVALSQCYLDAGDLARAAETARPALAHLRQIGLPGSTEAVLLAHAAAAASFDEGEETHAIEVCLETIDHASISERDQAEAYWAASVRESTEGSVAVAIPLAERALALLIAQDDTRHLARLRAELASMQMRRDPPDLEPAARQLEQARRDLEATGGTAIDIARCDVGLARLFLLKGQTAAARDLATTIVAQTEADAPMLAAEALVVEGESAATDGDWHHARATYTAAAALLTRAGTDRHAAQQWFELATMLDAAGDGDGARSAYRSAAASAGLRAGRRTTQSQPIL